MNVHPYPYKLLAFDFDETMLRPDSSLSDYAVGVVRAIAEKGVKVVPCTGRPYGGCLPHLRRLSLDTPGIFCNGAQICGALKGEVLDELPVSAGDTLAVIQIGLEDGAHPRIYTDDFVYVSHITEEDESYVRRTGASVKPVGDLSVFLRANPGKRPMKLMNVAPNVESVPAIFEKSRRFFKDRLYVTLSLESFIEYMNIGASKGNGVKKLADRWGIAKEDIIVAGDHLNDLTMFEIAGFSIAPQNAQPSVREAASCVCPSNAEDGVPHKLAEIFEICL